MWSFYYNLEVSRRDFPAHFFEFLQKKIELWRGTKVAHLSDQWDQIWTKFAGLATFNNLWLQKFAFLFTICHNIKPSLA